MNQTQLGRLLRGGALLLALCSCAPIAAAAFSQADGMTSAVSAPAPQAAEPKEDPAAEYRQLAAQGAALGLTQAECSALWAHGAADLSAGVQAWWTLPNSRPAYAARYRAAADEAESPAETVLRVNMDLDLTAYDDAVPAEHTGSTLILVNKYHGLAENFVPELEPLGKGYGRGELRPEAAAAFRTMADAAREDGISLKSVSAYRSYQTQNALYHKYCADYGQEKADTFSARPGFSEHQTGLALDINTASFSAHFEQSKEYAWLQEHCAEFGFMLRYREGKESITGYAYEPWHYRYVGREIARFCMERALTYEEYLAAQPAGEHAAPAVWYDGQALDLSSGALMWNGTLYVSGQALAGALGWSVSLDPVGQEETLYGPGRTVRLFRGNYCLSGGDSLLLSSPSARLDEAWYLSLDDLARAMGLTVRTEEYGLVLEDTFDAK